MISFSGITASCQMLPQWFILLSIWKGTIQLPASFFFKIVALNINVQKCMWKMKPVARLHLQKLYMLISLLLFVFLQNLNQINMQLSLSFYSKFTRTQSLKSYTKVVRITEYLCNKEETVSYNEAIILTSAINMNL